ncbi:hypothetical protein [Mumia zhuanghuii]|uniref:Uncharacterized protein n=1 Tax=Mumia zhuanghuii TaxID=2585211 RepID=A0A5C4MK57_9ACTN|nr:hypothetical protein [Mumia zhuanghuii]TNC44653.1 hypothetical protein FHE65_16505 [Mumia zhuanghuii]TNC51031.1 hypothetical protein FHE65_02350 [Mumia zhuanghuii]
MWDYEGFLGKAKIYFQRGAEHEHSHDDEFAIWHLLGFEFLLRAPLAKIHPSLLAIPTDNDSLLAANGITVSRDPKSAPSTVVIDRLGKIVSGFAGGPALDAGFLMNLRNAELHTSHGAVSDVSNDLWLPKLVRVAKILCAHLDLDVSEVVGDDVVTLGETLIDQADKKVEHEVASKLKAARAFLNGLTPAEVEARASSIQPTSFLERLRINRDSAQVACPACKQGIYAPKTYVRSSRERLDGDSLVRDDIYLLTGLRCPVCGLELTGALELVAAGIPQQVVEESHESLEERYQVEPEYDGAEYMDE